MPSSLFVAVRDVDGALHADFGACIAGHLGLRLRADEAVRCLRRAFAKYPIQWSDSEVLSGPGIPAIRQQVSKAAQSLARIACRPLTPKLVTTALRITNQERLRWTKDERLPSTHPVIIQRGQWIQIPTYAVADITRLRMQLETIATWRADDGRKGYS